MALQRVAVIFDHKVRPDTTGVYCRRALGRLVEVEHFLPSEVSRIPRNGFDLFLNIDDGMRYRIPKELRPAAWWAIDTHLDLAWYLTKAPDFDFVFTAQRDGAQKLRASGIDSATWLPLACDPEIHRKHDLAKRFDLCFVGNLFPGPRTDLLEAVCKNFPNTFVGQKFFEEMAETYSASRIVFNRSIENDINMRVFEALACGSLLLTNELHENGQEELFRDGIHLATYRDVAELLDKAAYYIKHEDLRERTAATGTEEALARHTYQHRMERLLQEVEQRLAKTTVALQAALPAESSQCSDSESPLRHVLDLIPKSARRILQFGGQTSLLADAIKARQPADIVAIEVVEAEAELPNQTFNVILCGDSLERTRQPLGLLQRTRNCLGPGGRFIASFANVRYHGVLRGLIQGNWTYDGEGVLTDRHVRFFTRREIEKLFYRAGIAIHEMQMIPGLGYREWEQQGQMGAVSLGALQIQGLRTDDAREFYVHGYIVSAEQESLPDYGLTSIFRAMIVRDSFVHHYGGKTFVATGVDFAGLMARNQEFYQQKWNKREESGKSAIQTVQAPRSIASTQFSLRVGDRGGLFLVAPAIRVSLCMIARDNKRTIGAAIESARRCVDEIIVVDTGSVDETPQIAASLGARVYHFPWCDDFSAARNESLKYATGDWIFWIDTDDTIDDENARKLRELPLDRQAPSVLGIVMQVHCPGSDDEGDLNMPVVDHVKLFRNLPELRFEFRIHEQILPAISRAGGEVVWSDLFVVHSGYDNSPEGQKKKLERDLRILNLELTERPNHPFTLFNLGMTYADIREFDNAIGYLRRSIECSSPGETQLRKAYGLLVHAFHQTERIDEAWYTCERGLELFPDDLELRFRRAILLQDRGRLHEAAEMLHGILQRPEERHFTSVVAGLRGYKTRHNLAIVYEELGDFARAEVQWRLITDEVPRYREGWLGLGDVLIKQRRFDEALDLAAKLQSDGRRNAEGAIIQSRLADAQSRSNSG